MGRKPVLSEERKWIIISKMRPSNFSMNEFKGPIWIEYLWDDINSDDYIRNIYLTRKVFSIGRLNQLLNVSDLYPRCLRDKLQEMITLDIQVLVNERERLDSHASFSEEEKQAHIVRLNRLLLQSLYPDTCPKVEHKKCIPLTPKSFQEQVYKEFRLTLGIRRCQQLFNKIRPYLL